MAAFSCFLSSTLDCFGYNYDIIQQRIQLITELIRILQAKIASIPIEIIRAGSKGEGIVSLISCSSDSDIMCILTDIICVAQAQDFTNFNILEAEFTGETFPGYTKLVCQRHREDFLRCSYEDFRLDPCKYMGNFLLSASKSHYISDNGMAYLSTPLFKNMFDAAWRLFLPPIYDTITFENNGPAVTARAQTSDFDLVPAIYYFETRYLNIWKTRRRLYDWPTSALITDISTSEGYIVPIGPKSSENQCLEWRICFTTSELKLIQNMNNVQLQLYMLLKMVKRHYLAPLCKGITSYVIKNIVFWISETTPIRLFIPSNLVNLLKRSLRFLTYCIRNNHLPNYMISERNLIHRALAVLERTHVLQTLSDILQNVERFLLEIPEIGKFMSCAYCRPDCVSLYGLWRNNVEKLMMAWLLLQEKCSTFIFSVNDSHLERVRRCFGDPTFLAILINLLNLTVPDWFSLFVTQQYDELRNMYQRNSVLLDFVTPN